MIQIYFLAKLGILFQFLHTTFENDPISDWHSTKNKLKGLSDETKMVNNYIEQVNSDLFETYQKLKSENKLVTSNIIKAYFFQF